MHVESETLLQRLRQATAPHHARLDHHAVLAPLNSGAVTPEHYQQALETLYWPQCQLEARVQAAAGPELARKGVFAPRAHFLAADLRALGMAVPDATPVVDRHLQWPEVLGYVYVLEGSRLGAGLLARRVRAALGEAVPCQFLSATHAAGQWQRVQAFLSDACPPRAWGQTCDAACEAFAGFETFLDASGEFYRP